MTLLSQTKYVLLPVMGSMLAAPQMASAQVPTSFSGLFACEQAVGDAAKLACYRAETDTLRGASAYDSSVAAEKERLAAESERLAIERERIAAEKESLAAARKPLFNDEFRKKPKAPKSQSVAIIKAVKLKVSGHTLFTLANGEVWQQTESKHVLLGRKSPDILVIKKGRVGGYLAKVNDRRPTFRVKQVR